MSINDIRGALDRVTTNWKEMRNGWYILVPNVTHHRYDDDNDTEQDLDVIMAFIREADGKAFLDGFLYTVQEGRNGTFINKFRPKRKGGSG